MPVGRYAKPKAFNIIVHIELIGNVEDIGLRESMMGISTSMALFRL